MSKLYYPVDTANKILNLQRGYTTPEECLRNHGPAGYDGVTQDTTPTPGYSVFNPPRNRVEVFDRNGLFAGYRDTEPVFIPAAPQPELYRYSMRNRPAGYGTCPDGRIIAEDKQNLYSEATPHLGTVSYTRKLTEKELYKWEMSPDSENAYTWAIGATVEDRESGEVLIVSAHHPRNWYTLYSAKHGEKWTVDRTGQDIQAVTPPEPPRFDGDYDYTYDTNTYPQDMIIYEPGINPALAELAALGLRIAEDFELAETVHTSDGAAHFVTHQPPRYIPPRLELSHVLPDGTLYTAEHKAEAERIIAAYARVGHEALWAKGKGGGFWLKSPAVYVSLEQARKDTAALVAVGAALDSRIARELGMRRIEEASVRVGIAMISPARQKRFDNTRNLIHRALHDKESLPDINTLERYYTQRYPEAIPAPVDPVDAALEKVSTNGRNNKAPASIIAAFRNTKTGQVRIVWRAWNDPYTRSSIALLEDGSMNGGYHNVDLNDGMWEFIRSADRPLPITSQKYAVDRERKILYLNKAYTTLEQAIADHAQYITLHGEGNVKGTVVTFQEEVLRGWWNSFALVLADNK